MQRRRSQGAVRLREAESSRRQFLNFHQGKSRHPNGSGQVASGYRSARFHFDAEGSATHIQHCTRDAWKTFELDFGVRHTLGATHATNVQSQRGSLDQSGVVLGESVADLTILEEDVEEDVEKDFDPYERYIELRVKKAQLVWTYIETRKKMDEMKNIIMAFPPKPEQQAIANFSIIYYFKVFYVFDRPAT